MVGSPSRTRLALAVVPPMSKEMTLRKPSAQPTCAEAMMPPTGPDSIMAAGRAIARHVHLARAQEPLVDLAREVARHQWPVTVKEQAVGLRPVAATDDVHVARAARDDEAGLGALSFDERVDGDGRAVDHLVVGDSGEGALADAVDDALPELRGGGEALGLHEAPGGVVEPDQIGEGASDIDGDDKHAWRLPPTASQDLRRARDTQRIFNVVRDCRIAPAVGR